MDIPHAAWLRGNGLRGRWLTLVAVALAACAPLPFNRETAEPATLPTRTPVPILVTPASPTPNTDARLPTCAEAPPPLQTTEPRTTASPGKIVFVNAEGNIALTDAEGRQQVNLTEDAFVSPETGSGRIYRFPSFSNDGQFVGFVGLEADRTGEAQVVYVARTEADAPPQALFRTAEFNIPYLDWSPDDRWIAFLTINPSRGLIRLVPREGGEVNVLQQGAPTYWHWHPRDDALVTHLGGSAADSPEASVSLLTLLRSGEARRTVLPALPGSFQSPHYAPDGKHMLYVAFDERQPDRLVVADAGGNPLCTVATIRENAFFAWSPNGIEVALMDTALPLTDPAALVLVNLRDGRSRTVHPAASTFFWSPDGRALAVYAPQRSERTGQIVGLRLSVINLDRNEETELAILNPTRSFLQYVQYFDQYSRAVTPWSPDGRRLVFSGFSEESDRAEIYVGTLEQETQTWSVRRIAFGSVAFWSPK
ncbi:MAG: hypothetical protein RMM31_08945 [Anaerolineae bacterium]|nr:hypothetical protein [Thermoflexales bacterium]MDW8396355.1 hypothetical protein [Anaerolineae bacterium]